MSNDKLAGRKTLKVSPILEELEKDRLKSSIDIVELFSSFGVVLEKKGSGSSGCCPFHKDDTPSLSVNKEKGLYNCFGCGESGDAFTLVEKMKGLDFKGALEYLKGSRPYIDSPNNQNTIVPITQNESIKIDEKPVQANLKETESLSEEEKIVLLQDVAKRYADDLLSEKEGRAYLAKRGLDIPELITTFKIGYVTGDLSKSLSDIQRAALTECGIFTESGREHFSKCIVVPLMAEKGSVIGFYGRKTDESKLPHLYMKGSHAGIMNRDAAKVYRDCLIFTEAVLDALSLYALGIKNVIPCYGANGFSKAHEELIKTERVKEAVIAFDADEAGRKGAKALSEKLIAQGLLVKIIESPKGKDWNEYLLQGGNASEIVELIENAVIVNPIKQKSPELVLSKEGGRHIFTREDIRYRLTGVKDSFQASLRVGVRLEYSGRSCVDTVDFYSGRSRSSFALTASQVGLESSRIEADLMIMLDALEAERDERLLYREEGKRELTDDEKNLGIEFLSDPRLFERIIEDLSVLGYVGEDVNKLLVYLAASSRKLDDPVSVIVSSQSAAGKSYLIDTVKKLMPEEDVVSMTSLSDQALNYLPDDALLHKFLIMGEAVHSDSVDHQLREMLSAKELARLVTMKDDKTGEMTSKLVRKDVIVSMVMSTTSTDVNPENASRCFVVAADESEAQTKAIHELQRGCNGRSAY